MLYSSFLGLATSALGRLRPLLRMYPGAANQSRSPSPTPPNKKTNPSSGWSFLAYSRVFARVRAGSCGLRRFPLAPGFGGFHSLLAVFLSGLAVRWRPKSTSVPNSRIANQGLTRGLIKRLIRGIGGRWEQQRQCTELRILEILLVGEPLRANFRPSS